MNKLQGTQRINSNKNLIRDSEESQENNQENENDLEWGKKDRVSSRNRRQVKKK